MSHKTWWSYDIEELSLAVYNALNGGGVDLSGTSDTQVLFNDGGDIGGSSSLIFDFSTVRPIGPNMNQVAGLGITTSQPVPATADLGLLSINGTITGDLGQEQVFSIQNHVEYTGTSTDVNGTLRAFDYDSFAKGTGAIGYLRGIHGFVWNASQSAITGMSSHISGNESDAGDIGFMTGWSHDSWVFGGTVGAVYGIYFGTPDFTGGAVTDLRQIYIGDLSGLTVSGVKQAFNYADKFIVDASGFIAGVEQTEPAAPAANGYRIFAKDTGGKTELLVRFNSGASQQLAIEP